jgi:hypothetical protein
MHGSGPCPEAETPDSGLDSKASQYDTNRGDATSEMFSAARTPATSASTVFELYTLMGLQGWLENPLQPTTKRERAQRFRFQPFAAETAAAGTDVVSDEQQPSEDPLKINWSEGLAREWLQIGLDGRHWRVRQFGDWYRRWKDQELPYLAAYGHVGPFERNAIGDASTAAEFASEQTYPGNDDEVMADSSEEAPTSARHRRHRRQRPSCRVIEIGRARAASVGHKRSGVEATASVPEISFPSHWSSTDKAVGVDLEEHTDRPRRAYYVGPGKLDTDAAAVRANVPVPTEACIYYYEMTVVSAGAEGFIGLGLCAGDVALERLPGWEKNSIGYHGDDGHIFRDSGVGSPYGPTYSTGDTVGCCWNCITGDVFFTKEGVRLKRAFRNVRPTRLRRGVASIPGERRAGNGGARSGSSNSSSSSSGGDGGAGTSGASHLPWAAGATRSPQWLSSYEGWYPVVGMRTVGEIVEANFGQKPFRFDIEPYVREEVEMFLDSIVAATADNDDEDEHSSVLHEQCALQNVVLDYLLTEGYVETARAFSKTVFPPERLVSQGDVHAAPEMDPPRSSPRHQLRQQKLPQALSDASIRASIMDYILRGEIEQARSLGAEHYPRFFQSPASLGDCSAPASETALDQQLAAILLRCQEFREVLAHQSERSSESYSVFQYACGHLWPLLLECAGTAAGKSALCSGPAEAQRDASQPPLGKHGRKSAPGNKAPAQTSNRTVEHRQLVQLLLLHHLILVTHADAAVLAPASLQRWRLLVAAAVNRALVLERPCRARPAGSSLEAPSLLARMLQHLSTVMEMAVEHGAGYLSLIQTNHLL